MKNKTLATWLALVGGPLGLHRFYLYGLFDLLGWLCPIPTALGLYGIERAQRLGVDDLMSWVLIPILGLMVVTSAFSAIFYGLQGAEKWNLRFNPGGSSEAANGQTNWLTVAALSCALFFGAGTLLATLAYSFEHYFEYTNSQIIGLNSRDPAIFKVSKKHNPLPLPTPLALNKLKSPYPQI